MAARSCTPPRDSVSMDSNSFVCHHRLADYTPERCRSPATPRLDSSTATAIAAPFPPPLPLGDSSSPALVTPRAACGGTAAAAALALCTPQTSHEELRLRACVDAELQRRGPGGFAAPAAVTPLVDGLYVGGIPDEEALELLRREGVDTIINCCAREYDMGEAVQRGFTVHNIAAEDRGDFLILFHCYDRFASIVNEARKHGHRVFVHCIAGINRSVTLCMAYMIQYCGMDPVHCVRLFQSRSRSDILQNVSFRHQLVDFYLNTPCM